MVNDMVCYGCGDQSIRGWRRESTIFHNLVAVIKGHSAPVKCITTRIDDIMRSILMIYKGSLDREIQGWHVILHALNEKNGYVD